MVLGSGDYKFQRVGGWGRTINGYAFPGMVAGLAVDRKKRLFVLFRAPEDEPVVRIFDLNGNFIASWGVGIFAEPHNLWVSEKDEVFIADRNDHTIRKFTVDGELLMTLGTPHKPGEPGMPFNGPAKAVCSRAGDIFVADGYNQTRIHRFSENGELLLSWGEKGSEDGQLLMPHGVWVEEPGRVIVADRLNHRVTVFDMEGRYLDSWGPVEKTNDIWVHDGVLYASESPVTLWTLNGEFLARVSDKRAHTMCVDPEGSVYATHGHTVDDTMLLKYERMK